MDVGFSRRVVVFEKREPESARRIRYRGCRVDDFEYLAVRVRTLSAREQDLKRRGITFLHSAEVEGNARLFRKIFKEKITERVCRFNIEEAPNFEHLAIALRSQSHYIQPVRLRGDISLIGRFGAFISR
jgi:hypothetical protein